METYHGTTIVSVRRGSTVALGGDGQVTLGHIVVKASARKVRKLYREQVLAGFAGATADAFTLFERFEAKLEKHQGHLVRAAIELTRDWRTDRVLRRLEAMLAVADATASLIITGNGDVLEPRAGHRRHRQRWRLCPGRGDGVAEPHRDDARADRQAFARDRRRHLHLHEPEPHRRDAGMTPDIDTENLTPAQIVAELDKHIVGQHAAKRAVAIALRNRWRRRRVQGAMQAEITPKNILMIGPTGVGKTEIARRLARLADAPFVKVEATKFTEVGYVGKDVDTIIRDLVEVSVKQERVRQVAAKRAAAQDAAEERILDILVPPPRDMRDARDARDARPIGFTAEAPAENTARQVMRKRLREGLLADKEIELDIADAKPALEVLGPQGMPGMEEMAEQLKGLFSQMNQPKKSKRKLTIAEALKLLVDEEAGRLVNEDEIRAAAVAKAEADGIVFIDEIDKVASRSDNGSTAEVSRQGVQRDLLPLVEGTAVTTKYGVVKTDHILFIASGAFHLAKPSDLIPELQGRFPIRVELSSLSVADFEAILTSTHASLVAQYQALLATEGVTVQIEPAAVRRLAEIAFEVNERTENIGARRLATVMERLLDEVSFDAPTRSGQTLVVDVAMVNARLAELAHDEDLSRYIL